MYFLFFGHVLLATVGTLPVRNILADTTAQNFIQNGQNDFFFIKTLLVPVSRTLFQEQRFIFLNLSEP